MRAAYLNTYSGPEGLIFGELPQPQPRKDEALVRVHATAVTPTEFDWFPTFKTRDGNPRPFPIILSHEFSGVIAGFGDSVSTVTIGDEIYGMNDWFSNGAQAEYCVAPASAIAPRPNSLDLTQAAVAPISILTAWQGLFDRCKLQAGERVLIHGGAGGVGLFAVQLARWRGAYVIATASAQNLQFVHEVGADEVIDYKTTRFETIVSNVDVVFDAVGGETLERSWRVMRQGGRAVTIVSPSAEANDQRAHDAFFIVEPNQLQLIEVTRLLDAGSIRVFVDAVFPLNQAREAYLSAQRPGKRGKIALRINVAD